MLCGLFLTICGMGNKISDLEIDNINFTSVELCSY